MRLDHEFEIATLEIYECSKIEMANEQDHSPAIGMYDDDSGFSTVSEDDLSSDSDAEMMEFWL